MTDSIIAALAILTLLIGAYVLVDLIEAQQYVATTLR